MPTNPLIEDKKINELRAMNLGCCAVKSLPGGAHDQRMSGHETGCCGVDEPGTRGTGSTVGQGQKAWMTQIKDNVQHMQKIFIS